MAVEKVREVEEVGTRRGPLPATVHLNSRMVHLTNSMAHLHHKATARQAPVMEAHQVRVMEARRAPVTEAHQVRVTEVLQAPVTEAQVQVTEGHLHQLQVPTTPHLQAHMQHLRLLHVMN